MVVVRKATFSHSWGLYKLKVEFEHEFERGRSLPGMTGWIREWQFRQFKERDLHKKKYQGGEAKLSLKLELSLVCLKFNYALEEIRE